MTFRVTLIALCALLLVTAMASLSSQASVSEPSPIAPSQAAVDAGLSTDPQPPSL